MASNNADFESKGAGIIGLYLNPPQNAAVLFESSARQKEKLLSENGEGSRLQAARFEGVPWKK